MLNPAASAESIAVFVKKAAKTLKVAPSRIPAEYLAFLARGNGGSGNVGDQGAWVRLDPLENLLKDGKGYHFTSRGWLYIGGDGGGSGFGIDLTAEPPAYVLASYVDMSPAYLGASLEEMLESVASGQFPPQPGQPMPQAAGAGQAGLIHEANPRGVGLLGWTRDGRCLFSKGDGCLAEFDVPGGKFVRQFTTPPDQAPRMGILAAARSPDGRLTVADLCLFWVAGDERRLLTMFDTATGQLQWQTDLQQRGSREGWVFFSPDRASLIVQMAGMPLRLYDSGTGKLVRSFSIPSDYAHGRHSMDCPAAISPDGTKISIANWQESKTHVFDLSSGAQVVEIPHRVSGLAWSDDGSSLLLAGEVPQIKILDASDWSLHHTFATHYGTRWVFMRDGRLAALDYDGIYVWDVRSHTLLGHLAHQADQMTVAADGRTALTWDGSTRCVRLWRLPGGEVPAMPRQLPTIDPAATETHPIGLVSGISGRIREMKAAGERLAVASGQGILYLWNTATWTILHEIREPPLFRRVPDLSADGRRVLGFYRGQVVGEGNQAHLIDGQWAAIVWDTTSGRELARLPATEVLPASATLASEGDAAWVAMDDKRIVRWDLATNALHDFAATQGQATCIAASANGKLLAVGTSSEPIGAGIWPGCIAASGGTAAVEFFDAATGQSLGQSTAKEGLVRSITFSANGRQILTVHLPKTMNDAVVALHDVAKRKQLRKFDPIEHWLTDPVWLAGDEQFIVGGTVAWKAYRFAIARAKKEETLAAGMEIGSFTSLARVRDNLLVSGGGSQTWSLRVWQLVPNSKPKRRVPEE